ncbi:MAG: hypothetical protein ACXW2T_00965 [Allosphingosinicella sp.]
MRKLPPIFLGIAAFATPVAAQTPVFDDSLDRDIAEAIPAAEEVEALAPVMDVMVGALMNVEVGPLLDAADPYHRRDDHGLPGRTLGDLASRDDPQFEARMRSSIYGVTSDMGRMMEAVAVAAPAMRRSLREFERGIEGALEDYERSRPVYRRDRHDDGPDHRD